MCLQGTYLLKGEGEGGKGGGLEGVHLITLEDMRRGVWDLKANRVLSRKGGVAVGGGPCSLLPTCLDGSAGIRQLKEEKPEAMQYWWVTINYSYPHFLPLWFYFSPPMEKRNTNRVPEKFGCNYFPGLQWFVDIINYVDNKICQPEVIIIVHRWVIKSPCSIDVLFCSCSAVWELKVAVPLVIYSPQGNREEEQQEWEDRAQKLQAGISKVWEYFPVNKVAINTGCKLGVSLIVQESIQQPYL